MAKCPVIYKNKRHLSVCDCSRHIDQSAVLTEAFNKEFPAADYPRTKRSRKFLDRYPDMTEAAHEIASVIMVVRDVRGSGIVRA